MEDKVIEIARFEHTTEAEMLASLLKSQGIECYVRDSISSSNFFGSVDIGGAKVELLKKDARRALDIMKEYNYEIPGELREITTSEEQENINSDGNEGISGENEEDNGDNYDEADDSETGYDEVVYANNKARLSKQMTIIIVIIVILLGLLIFMNKYYNG